MEEGIVLKPLELDALREAGNMGAGRAATALSQMLGTRVSIRESFITIFTHPLVWFYAAAYACTGAVRNSSDQLSISERGVSCEK